VNILGLAAQPVVAGLPWQGLYCGAGAAAGRVFLAKIRKDQQAFTKKDDGCHGAPLEP
jgi:hypothetical protein